MARAPGQVRIGTSGWSYQHWRDGFYPPRLKSDARLSWYAEQFDTVEINASFYRLPSEAAVASWAAAAPPDFLFAWKASRYITHARKLIDPRASLDLVFGRMAPLGAALGPALFQLPPRFRRNDARLAAFLSQLPSGHRVAMEFRDASWFCPEVMTLLADHDVAFCIGDHADAPSPWEATASFVYLRGHGPAGTYAGRYPSDCLADWARRLDAWRAAGRDVYVYFDNDIGGAAPLDASALLELMKPSAASVKRAGVEQARVERAGVERAGVGQ